MKTSSISGNYRVYIIVHTQSPILTESSPSVKLTQDTTESWPFYTRFCVYEKGLTQILNQSGTSYCNFFDRYVLVYVSAYDVCGAHVRRLSKLLRSSALTDQFLSTVSREVRPFYRPRFPTPSWHPLHSPCYFCGQRTRFFIPFFFNKSLNSDLKSRLHP